VTAPRELWLRQAGRAAALLSTLAGAVWLSGLPLLFPSLGPTAYLFATKPAAPECDPRRVVVGHAIGVLAGFAAFHGVGAGVALDTLTAPGSVPALRLAVSGVVAVGLTTAGMVATDTGHAPACATTLIVSLGILTTPRAALLIVVAVVVLVAEQRVLDRVGV
jgi:CBS-domain-containing membrane protein